MVVNGVFVYSIKQNQWYSLISNWYGYDNDELIIYSSLGGFLYNVKVNEIIKHQLPKSKFCTDYNVLHQQQLQITAKRNELLKQQNELTQVTTNYHQDQLQYLPCPSSVNQNPYHYNNFKI